MGICWVGTYKEYRKHAINNRGYNSKILILTLSLSHKKGTKIAF